MTDELTTPDFSQLTFDEFIAFFFDRNVPAEEHWAFDYSDAWLREFYSPVKVVHHLTKLFREFAQIAPRYSLPQINAGIWAMFGGAQFELEELLWNTSIPLSERLDCIRAMYFVYSDFVALSKVEVMENCFYMWWDQVASNFWFAEQNRAAHEDAAKLDADSRALLDAMFETLAKILALPDERTRSAALHGLGHLHHSGVPALVQDFIRKNRDEMSPEGLRWVEQCRDGTVM